MPSTPTEAALSGGDLMSRGFCGMGHAQSSTEKQEVWLTSFTHQPVDVTMFLGPLATAAVAPGQGWALPDTEELLCMSVSPLPPS